jgi:uncharacterized membrane protein YcgQ (UPF0703/DUF1980 family)
MKSFVTPLIFLISSSVIAQTEGWTLFAKTKFEAKYNATAREYFLYPNFSADLKAMVGKEVELEGFHLPIDIADNAYIILSKFPFAQCFFCGGAGPESIAEVSFKTKQGRFEPDEFIRVRGRLKLNETDIDHGNFILEDAVLISK